VAFCVGVVAILAWQPSSDAARRLVETSSLQLGVVAPITRTTPDRIAPAAVAASFLDKQHLAAAVENVDQRADSREQIDLKAVQLGSAAERITRDFESLQLIERHTISTILVPLPRPVPAETRKYALRPAAITAGAGASAHHAVTSFTSFGSSSSSPVASMRLDTHRKRTPL